MMVRTVAYALCSTALLGLGLALAWTVLEPPGGPFGGGALHVASLAISIVGILLAAGLCVASGSRRGVPAIAVLAAPIAAMVLAAAGSQAGASAVLDAAGAGAVASEGAATHLATALAFVFAGLAFLSSCLAGACAREDEYEPASKDPLRWAWVGAGAGLAAVVAVVSLISAGGVGQLFGGPGVAVLLVVATLMGSPLAILTIGCRTHDLSRAPEGRMSAALTAGALGIAGATLCFGMAAPYVPAALALERIAGAAAGELGATASATASELGATYRGAHRVELVALGAAVVMAALVLVRAYRRPQSWVPAVAALVVGAAASLWLGASATSRLSDRWSPLCEQDCLPSDVALAFTALAGLPELAPADPCDPPPTDLPTRLDETLRPLSLETEECAAEGALVVVVSTTELTQGGERVAAIEGGGLPPAALEDRPGGQVIPALLSRLESAPARGEGAAARTLQILLDRESSCGLVDALTATAAAAGISDVRFVGAGPGRQRPPAYREVPAPVPESSEGSAASARPVAGACAGTYAAGPHLTVEVSGETPCGAGDAPRAELWQLQLEAEALHLVGPWGESLRGREAPELVAALGGVIDEARRQTGTVRVLVLQRAPTLPFARELGVRAALAGGDEPFAAVVVPAGAEMADSPPTSEEPVTAWRATIGGIGEDGGSGVALTTDGGVLAAGTFGSYVDLDPGEGVEQVRGRGTKNEFVLSFDSQGNRRWGKALRGMRRAWSGALAARPDGSSVVTGDFWGTVDLDPGPEVIERSADGERAAALVRLDPAGDLLWARAIGQLGARVEGRGVELLPDGSIVLAGVFSGRVDFDPGEGESIFEHRGDGDIFVARFDPEGSLDWVRIVGGQGADWAADIGVAPNGTIIVVGQVRGVVDLDPGPGARSHTASPFGDLVVLAFDSAGDFRWASVMPGTSEIGQAAPAALAVAADGSIVVGGSFDGRVDFDPGEGTEEHQSMASRGESPFVLRLSPTGALVWARTYASTLTAAVEDVAFAPDGFVIGAGFFTDRMDLDPTEGGVDERTCAGDTDLFLSAIAPDGAYGGGLVLGGPRIDGAGAVAVAPDGTIVVAGRFSRSADLDAGEGVDERSSEGETDGFVARLPRSALEARSTAAP